MTTCQPAAASPAPARLRMRPGALRQHVPDGSRAACAAHPRQDRWYPCHRLEPAEAGNAPADQVVQLELRCSMRCVCKIRPYQSLGASEEVGQDRCWSQIAGSHAANTGCAEGKTFCRASPALASFGPPGPVLPGHPCLRCPTLLRHASQSTRGLLPRRRSNRGCFRFLPAPAGLGSQPAGAPRPGNHFHCLGPGCSSRRSPRARGDVPNPQQRTCICPSDLSRPAGSPQVWFLAGSNNWPGRHGDLSAGKGLGFESGLRSMPEVFFVCMAIRGQRCSDGDACEAGW